MATSRSKTDADWAALRGEVMDAFSPGAPVEEAALFSGRITQIKALKDTVLQRGRHAVLFGERGVGKTSIANVIGLTMRSPNKEALCVRVNCDPTDSFTSIWKKVFKRMTYASTDKSIKKISDDIQGDLSPDDVQLLLSEFNENQIPIIVLDEFDRIQDEKTNQLVADTIKALSDYSVNATLIIVGVAEDISSLIRGHESITRSLIQVKMPRMSNEEIKQIILTRYKRCGITTDENAIWKMARLSRGLPYYAHSIAMYSAIYCIENKRTEVKHEDIDNALGSSIAVLDQSIKEIYVKATRSQRGEDTLYPFVLLACAYADVDELGRFQQVAVVNPLNKLTDKEYPTSTFAKHMNAFCEPDRGSVLKKHGSARNFRYCFSDPMFQPYVILKGISEGRVIDEEVPIFAAIPQMLLPFSTEN
jgi:AAA domain